MAYWMPESGRARVSAGRAPIRVLTFGKELDHMVPAQTSKLAHNDVDQCNTVTLPALI